MLFSFIIPVYNVEKYLRRCLESVLCQTGAPFEILLIDDGSQDSSGEICDEYAGKYPDIVRVLHKENEGPFLSRRKGFRLAKGDWLICVDSDDRIDPNLLQCVVKAIEENKSDLVVYNYMYEYGDGTTKPSTLNWPEKTYSEGDKQFIYKSFLLSDNNNVWVKAFRSEIIDYSLDYSKLGVRFMGDDAVETMGLYTNAGRITYIERPLYYYRKSEETITGRGKMNYYWELENVRRLERSYIRKWQVPEDVVTHYYTNCVTNTCGYFRWLFSGNAKKDNEGIEDLFFKVKQSESYVLAKDHWKVKYLKTAYLKISVPIMMFLIHNNRIGLLKSFVRLERKLRG